MPPSSIAQIEKIFSATVLALTFPARASHRLSFLSTKQVFSTRGASHGPLGAKLGVRRVAARAGRNFPHECERTSSRTAPRRLPLARLGEARRGSEVRTEADARQQRAGEVERRDVARRRLRAARAVLAKRRAAPVRELVDPTCAHRTALRCEKYTARSARERSAPAHTCRARRHS